MLDKIKKIKYARMKPEERFVFDIVTNVVEYYHKDHLTYKYYKYNDVLFFEYNLKNGNFWCHYSKFWSVLDTKYSLDYQQIQSLVKHMVEDHLICKDVTPVLCRSMPLHLVEDHLICKDVTPVKDPIKKDMKVEDHLICKDVTPCFAVEGSMKKVEEHLICKDV